MSATATVSNVPFPKDLAINTESLACGSHPSGQLSSSQPNSISYVPGEPTVTLDSTEINAHLSAHLETRLLDELYHYLWLVARKFGHSIDTLHVQRIKGRNIVPAEDPRLHLVWQHNRIYIKPLPVYLLNFEFWENFLGLPETSKMGLVGSETVTPSFDRTVSVGFLRSYAFLIEYHIDFIMAKELHLIPEDVEWIRWSKFIHSFRCLKDDHVAKRYHYGQLRLSRLNWVVRLVHPQHSSTNWFYHVPHWSITEYLAQATIPLLFIFASISLALSSMQVVLSVSMDGLRDLHLDEAGVRHVNCAFWVFSIAILFLVGLLWVLLLGIPLVVLIWQNQWGFREHRKEAQAKTSSIV
ncbi:MAG: hypothetical protein M1822_008302 [Bathelium mastoideum]|nr:MAG: hypothetical protein M1822_008302 [Bathelium mastoideum]